MTAREACHRFNEGRVTVFWLVVTFAVFTAVVVGCVGMVVDAYWP